MQNRLRMVRIQVDLSKPESGCQVPECACVHCFFVVILQVFGVKNSCEVVNIMSTTFQ